MSVIKSENHQFIVYYTLCMINRNCTVNKSCVIIKLELLPLINLAIIVKIINLENPYPVYHSNQIIYHFYLVNNVTGKNIFYFYLLLLLTNCTYQ